MTNGAHIKINVGGLTRKVSDERPPKHPTVTDCRGAHSLHRLVSSMLELFKGLMGKKHPDNLNDAKENENQREIKQILRNLDQCKRVLLEQDPSLRLLFGDNGVESGGLDSNDLLDIDRVKHVEFEPGVKCTKCFKNGLYFRIHNSGANGKAEPQPPKERSAREWRATYPKQKGWRLSAPATCWALSTWSSRLGVCVKGERTNELCDKTQKANSQPLPRQAGIGWFVSCVQTIEHPCAKA
jgi:hypothetical protein